jgi:hypothetical protein
VEVAAAGHARAAGAAVLVCAGRGCGGDGETLMQVDGDGLGEQRLCDADVERGEADAGEGSRHVLIVVDAGC